MAPPLRIFGEPDATIDWCESNFEVSEYVAEFWNTISSLFILVSPLMGLFYMKNQNLERRCHFMMLVMIVIGIGSVLFHCTLRYSMQLMDEVPMIYGTSAICYFLFEVKKPPNSANVKLILLLTVYCAAFTISYLTVKNPYIHETMFLILVAVNVLCGFKMIFDKGAHLSDNCKKLFALGIVMYVFSGLTWNGDNRLCSGLQGLRMRHLPHWMAPVTQLHAWWHFFSGIGTYVITMSLMEYRMRILDRPCDVKWKWFGPILILQPKPKSIYDHIPRAKK
ncbi:hypothetical protein TCAL_06304 [Tigriopus californicus]|uniref:Alkaline ceramidase n=1 Tax=Tigriopus californicus TaxID=6832 RepID=A0A553PSS9_TIGCA|nr:alkaline ceramidase 3-like isoform X1 [Tigriopus californicus]XP_059097856.1 alkaline ceramidase 3-like isoform X1 [Tigriopus californicus]TRY80726.1 hypothetical protein TCAL_06304 [Tigriopus californicus]